MGSTEGERQARYGFCIDIPITHSGLYKTVMRRTRLAIHNWPIEAASANWLTQEEEQRLIRYVGGYLRKLQISFHFFEIDGVKEDAINIALIGDSTTIGQIQRAHDSYELVSRISPLRYIQ